MACSATTTRWRPAPSARARAGDARAGGHRHYGAGNVHYSILLRRAAFHGGPEQLDNREKAAELLSDGWNRRRPLPVERVFIPPRLVLRESSTGDRRRRGAWANPWSAGVSMRSSAKIRPRAWVSVGCSATTSSEDFHSVGEISFPRIARFAPK